MGRAVRQGCVWGAYVCSDMHEDQTIKKEAF